MVVRLTVPGSHRRPVTVPRGSDLRIFLYHQSRTTPLDAQDAGVLTVRRRPLDEPIISKAGLLVPTEGENVMRFDLSDGETSTQLDPRGLGGRFLLDVAFMRDGMRDVFPLSPLVLEPLSAR